MPTTPVIIARNQRILAGAASGATIRALALAEAVDPAVVRRVLRAAGQPIPGRAAPDAQTLAALADSAWLQAEYATKAAGQIARELGCSAERVYAALHAAGIPMRQNRYYPSPTDQVDAELADRIVARYVAGAGPGQIAAELGVQLKVVRNVVRVRGVRRSQSEAAVLRQAARGRPTVAPSQLSPELEAAALERYAAGASGEAVAAALGLSASRVYRLLRGRGVARTQQQEGEAQESSWVAAEPVQAARAPVVRGPLPAELAEQILARYAAGEPPGALALALGVPASRIYRFLRERGVLRSRSEARALSCALRWAGVARKRAEAGPAGRARREEWPAELAAEVLARYAVGEPAPAIAEALGLTQRRVYALLRERGMVRTKSEAKRIGAKGVKEKRSKGS